MSGPLLALVVAAWLLALILAAVAFAAMALAHVNDALAVVL